MGKSHNKYTRIYLIKTLQDKAKELGRVPIAKDMESDKSVPSMMPYKRVFGSWNNALRAAGLDISKDYIWSDYSDEDLLSILKEKAEELGRTPTTKDVNADNYMPTATIYRERFGSWSNALEAAEIEDIFIRKEYSDQELIEALKKKAKELGRSPTGKDINLDNSMASEWTYRHRFGSYTKALEKAGLKPNVIRKKKRSLTEKTSGGKAVIVMKRYTKKYLIEKLQEKARELGRIPTKKEVNEDSSMPSVSVYEKTFGSYRNAYKHRVKVLYKNEKLLELLRIKAEELGRAPTSAEINEDKYLPNVKLYQIRFGSWSKALEKAGLKMFDGKFEAQYSDKELLDFLKKKHDELGKTPSTNDVKADKSMPGLTTYSYRFGSWNKALEAAGLETMPQEKYDEEYLVQRMREKAEELGRTPTAVEVKKDKDMPSVSIYQRRFGSFNKALEAAGLKKKRSLTEKLLEERL